MKMTEIYPAWFAFALDQKVMVKAINMPGVIVGRRELASGRHDYLVVWWNNCERQEQSLYEHELEALPA